MALKERTVIDRCEVLASGDIQVREAKQIYDTLITPTPEKLAVTEERIVPAVDAVLDDDSNEIEPAIGETTETVVISPSEPAVTDVKAQEYHRFVIAKNDITPANVQAFIDNARAV